jgi:hypothetical protein
MADVADTAQARLTFISLALAYEGLARLVTQTPNTIRLHS